MSLTNADFRSLLNAADQSVLAHLVQPSKKRNKSTFDDERREKRKQKYLRLQKAQNAKKEGGEVVLEEGGYRDRAAERRKCNDDFYQQVADELNEMKNRSIEESKFLGGDIEHTHLVKGLDFALLAKIRSELEKNAQDEKLKEEKEHRIAATNKLDVRTITGRLIFKSMYEELHPHSSLFAHKLNKIQNLVLKAGSLRPKDATKEGSNKWLRMSYVFNLDFDAGNSDEIPVLQLNAKESVKDYPRHNADKNDDNDDTHATHFVPYLHPRILSELSKVTEWHLENRKKKKGERLLRRVDPNGFVNAQNAAGKKNAKYPVKDNDADEDIFSGAGGLDVAELLAEDEKKKEKEKEEKKKGKTEKKKSYFDNAGKVEEEEEEEKRKEMEEIERLKSAPREDIIREEEGMEVEEDDQQPTMAAPNAWGVCQPPLPLPTASYPQLAPVVDASGAAMYGMGVYAYGTQHVPGMAATAAAYNPPQSRVDTNATPFVSTEPQKIIKSGMTTVDQDKGFYSVFKRDEAAFKKRGKEDEREKDPSYVSDTYMECYPGFGADVSFEAYSDDDEDRSKMDMGRQKQYGAKHKHQFNNENDWEKYQLRKEALPKAAFQYGRKMDDNRVTRRRKKMNTEEEWKKIEKMIGDNKASREER